MDKVEHVARAMAIADGFDPDEIGFGGPDEFATKASNFSGFDVGYRLPIWQQYQRRANLLIAGLEALSARTEA